MRRTARLATGAFVLGVVGFTGAPAASAQQVACDAYGQTCPAIPGEGVLGTQFNQGAGNQGAGTQRTGAQGAGTQGGAVSGRTTPNTLPFTGGEVVLLSLLGVGTLAGGAALVVAGRRRTPATA
ncbi:MAG: hypothetical protein KY451_00870 [Actinobacteria bacterium]|nr:hypothetical protein [Actinomycetota bacterium]MBW3646765.1 hypothetical protein [Actinomycetota bacterium]